MRNRSSQDPLNYPIRLNNKIAALMGIIESADHRPTDQTYEVFEELSKELDTQLQQMKTTLKSELPRLNAALKREKVEAVDPNAKPAPPAPAAHRNHRSKSLARRHEGTKNLLPARGFAARSDERPRTRASNCACVPRPFHQPAAGALSQSRPASRQQAACLRVDLLGASLADVISRRARRRRRRAAAPRAARSRRNSDAEPDEMRRRRAAPTSRAPERALFDAAASARGGACCR